MTRTLRLVIAVAVVIASFGCRKDSAPKPLPATVDSRPSAPALFVIGNDRGMLRPCGCSKPVLGGVDRRIAFFDSIAKSVRDRSAVIACGNIVTVGGRQQELKIESFLQAMSAMGVEVYCVGDLDMHVGTAYWTESAAQIATFPLVSSNLMKSNRRLFRSHAVVTTADADFVVTGWTSPTSAALSEPGLEAVADPDLSEVFGALSEKSNGRPRTLVLYSSAPRAEASAFLERSGLAARAPKTLVCLATVADLPTVTVVDAKTTILEIGTKGRHVAEMSPTRLDHVERHVLDADVGTSTMGKELLQLYRDAVGFEELLQKAPTFGAAVDTYAGDETCKQCHRQADGVWRKSLHARAWKTLEETGDTSDPECVRCHVVGFGEHGGFDPVGKTPVNVQCEACHGPSNAHGDDVTQKTPVSKPDQEVCIRCHDIENSPHFDFKTYWPRIAHGKEK